MPGPAGAACVGALYSLLVMWLPKDKAVCWRAWFFMIVVMGMDGASAAGVLPVLRTLHLPAAIPEFWHVAVAGVLGPVLLRARTPDSWGFLGGKRPLMPFRSIQADAEAKIAKMCSEAEADWLGKVLPKISSMPLEEVRDWIVDYLNSLDRKGGEDGHRDKINAVRVTADDEGSPEGVRRRSIVLTLLSAEKHRAVRKLLRHARSASPPPLLPRVRFHRRLSAERLCERLVLPPGFRKDLSHGKVRIGYPDRQVDDGLLRLAGRIATELAGRARVEGVYEGWITVSAPLPTPEEDRYGCAIAWLVRRLTDPAVGLGAVVQPHCTVLDEATREYAAASLAVIPKVSPRAAAASDRKDVISAQQGLRLVAEVVAVADGAADGHTYKKNLYGTAGVPVYVVLDIPQGEIWTYTRPLNGEYRTESVTAIGDELRLPHPFDVTLQTVELALQTHA